MRAVEITLLYTLILIIGSISCTLKHLAEGIFYPLYFACLVYKAYKGILTEFALAFSVGNRSLVAFLCVKIEYVELSATEFAEKMTSFTASLQDLFTQSHGLEQKIKDQIGRIKYE